MPISMKKGVTKKLEMEETTFLELNPFEFRFIPKIPLICLLLWAPSTTANRKNKKQTRKLCWSLTSPYLLNS